MNDELIQKLAEKMGVTIEHLWGVLITQAGIEAIVGIAIVLFLIVPIVVGFFVTKRQVEIDSDYGVCWVIYGMMVVLLSSVCISEIGNIITYILNPEYWALMQINH